MDELHLLQTAAKPPSHQTQDAILLTRRKNPGAVAIHLNGEQLMKLRQFELVWQIFLRLERSQKGFDDITRGDDNDDRLLIFGRARQEFHAPDDLIDRKGRELFELELDHRNQFVLLDNRQVNDAQEHLVGREPRDIQPALPEGLFSNIGRQRFARRRGLFMGEFDLVATD